MALPETQYHAHSAIQDVIAHDARELSEKLRAHRLKLFPPSARKSLRRFASGEAAKLIGINDGYLRQLSLEGRVLNLKLQQMDGDPIHSKIYRDCVLTSTRLVRVPAAICLTDRVPTTYKF